MVKVIVKNLANPDLKKKELVQEKNQTDFFMLKLLATKIKGNKKKFSKNVW